jgi:hypothetical protein
MNSFEFPYDKIKKLNNKLSNNNFLAAIYNNGNVNLDVINIDKLSLGGNYCIHEVISNQKRKPYLDLEKKFPNKKSYQENYIRILNNLIEDIIDIFNNEYGEKIQRKDILLLSSSDYFQGGFLMSYHIIISPTRTLYYTNSLHYTMRKDSAHYLYVCLTEKNDIYREILDERIYQDLFIFRIPGSYKNENDLRKMNPIDSTYFCNIDITKINLKDYLLTSVNIDSKCLC